jgi:hypothetical protein
MLTFQIGLHVSDVATLQYIKDNLKCGHITISGSKCNYFINDKESLIQIILPIFNAVKLNSSKYYQFIIFEKAVNLIKNKNHLTSNGKLNMISLHKAIKGNYLAPSSEVLSLSNFTLHWLGGFTDGDGSFSISNYKPRLKYENHIKELELFKKIKMFLGTSANINLTKQRVNRPNSNLTVCLDITKIEFLKHNIITLFSEPGILKNKKLKDFKDWCILTDLYYFGYHLTSEGKILINEIKNQWNNFRLLSGRSPAPTLDLETRFKEILLIPCPYEVKNGIRYIRGTNNLVSESLNIICIDTSSNKILASYSSISECSRNLKINRATIKKYLLTGETYKNFKFIIK